MGINKKARSKIKFERIPLVLKKYSFSGKIGICQFYSRQFINVNKFDILKEGIIYPWELEAFALFSIFSMNEYDNKVFDDKHIDTFFGIINSIREYVHPEFKNSNVFKEKFITLTALVQFKFQEEIRYRLYRYNYIFNFTNSKVNIIKEFSKKFECKYSDFLSLIFFMHILFCYGKIELISYVMSNELPLIKKLSISREEFVSKQKKYLPKGIDSTYYAFKYLKPYPFILEDKIYHLPLPHLIIDSITDSLLARLTDKNDELRSLIGKEVIESYLFDILLESNAYEEVVREVSYSVKRNQILSPDIMVYQENRCVLFDCKSSVPPTKLRDFDENTYEEIIQRCVENMIKTYNRINEFGKYYRPFKKRNDFNRKDVYGVVVLLEDNFILKYNFYNKIAEILCLDENSPELLFIKSNIKILNLYDIEKVTFVSQDYSKRLEYNRDNQYMWYDLTLVSPDIKKEKFKNIKSLNAFISFLEKTSVKFAKGLNWDIRSKKN